MFVAALKRRNFHFAGAPRASGLESHLHVDPLDTRPTPWRNADSVQRLSLKQAIAESLCERGLLRRKVMLFPQDVTATQHPRNIGPDWEFGGIGAGAIKLLSLDEHFSNGRNIALAR